MVHPVSDIVKASRLPRVPCALVTVGLLFLAAVCGMSQREHAAPAPFLSHSVFTQSGANEYQLVAFVESVFENNLGRAYALGAQMPGLTESVQYRVSPKPAKPLIISRISMDAIPPCQVISMAFPSDDRPPVLALARNGRISTGPPARV